jgi:chromosome segregation ATPase
VIPPVTLKHKRTRRGRSDKEKAQSLTQRLHAVETAFRAYRENATYLLNQQGTSVLQTRVQELRDELLRERALKGAAENRITHWRTRYAEVDILKDEIAEELAASEAAREAAFSLLKKHKIPLPEFYNHYH